MYFGVVDARPRSHSFIVLWMQDGSGEAMQISGMEHYSFVLVSDYEQIHMSTARGYGPRTSEGN